MQKRGNATKLQRYTERKKKHLCCSRWQCSPMPVRLSPSSCGCCIALSVCWCVCWCEFLCATLQLSIICPLVCFALLSLLFWLFVTFVSSGCVSFASTFTSNSCCSSCCCCGCSRSTYTMRWRWRGRCFTRRRGLLTIITGVACCCCCCCCSPAPVAALTRFSLMSPCAALWSD